MPDTLLESGSVFDQKKSALGWWLREHFEGVRSLPFADLGGYDVSFAAGWLVEVEHHGSCLPLKILVDRQFPYSPIRIALESNAAYLRWPHVERGGLLCLQRTKAPLANLEAVIVSTIKSAVSLVEKCQDPQFVIDEFCREFVSYWTRGQSKTALPLRSLLNPLDHNARLTVAWFGQSFTLIGESAEQLQGWYQNYFTTRKSATLTPSVFAVLNTALIPPLPDRHADLFGLLEQQSPDTRALIETLPITERIALVLAARARTGTGLIGVRIEPPSLNGFRKTVPANAKIMLWKSRSRMARVSVERFDPAWVHGRGHDDQQPTLEKSSVLVIGCGSLGSQVAVRLAQSGVGTLRIVDPDLLTSANVGRHALGISSVGKFKARELDSELRLRFPHIRLIESFSLSWQELFEQRPELFLGATLIVACLGEWSGDGQLGEWQTHNCRPIVYGWLDEYGVAAHAVALNGCEDSLACILDDDGSLRSPETQWKNEGAIQAEPACGTLFQPYGALDVAQGEMLVSRLCVDVLTDKVRAPIHRVHAASIAQIEEAGGSWSDQHMRQRPDNFGGAFEYERSVSACRTTPKREEAA